MNVRVGGANVCIGDGVTLCVRDVRGVDGFVVASTMVGKCLGKCGVGDAVGDKLLDWQAEQASTSSRINRFILDS